MTPAARIAAAIDVLERYLAGAPVEKALGGWARAARYAGSKDRAAVRDHVFDALRRLRSDAALGGARTGRGLMIGALRRTGAGTDGVFTGQTHAPAALSDAERQAGRPPATEAERLDIPDWLWPQFRAGQARACEVARALQSRAPVHLRVNTARADRARAIALLSRDGVIAERHHGADTALQVVAGARRVRLSAAYRDGMVELQDAASQAVVAGLPLKDGMRVLDYCAGGGGKALAMAARARIDLFAHDIAPSRMRDLPGRAARAGIRATLLAAGEAAGCGGFDLVLCDVPCSGSGAWRRSPEGKWLLTRARLDELVQVQGDILRQAAGFVVPAGVVAYVTCSLLTAENAAQVAKFLQDQPDWRVLRQKSWPLRPGATGADGFYSAHLTRE